MACHAPGVTAQQRAELFIGGLPDHIRVDVELRETQDLQTAMYYASAFERRAQALQQATPARGGRQPARPPPTTSVPGRITPATPAATAPAMTRTFCQSLRPSSSSDAAKGFALTAMNPKCRATSVRAYSTWR